MATFVKLTELSEVLGDTGRETVWVNMDHVLDMRRRKDTTMLTRIDDGTLWVEETPEEICKKSAVTIDYHTVVG